MTRPTAEQRFWAKTDASGDECWPWTGARNKDGYGLFWLEGKPDKAHRVSYLLVNGPIPEGMVVDHKCRVRHCVRPCHLRVITVKQNTENRKGARRDSKSGVLGVSWNTEAHKWVAQVQHLGKNHYAGRFTDIRMAEAAAIAKRNELFTHNDKDRQ